MEVTKAGLCIFKTGIYRFYRNINRSERSGNPVTDYSEVTLWQKERYSESFFS